MSPRPFFLFRFGVQLQRPAPRVASAFPAMAKSAITGKASSACRVSRLQRPTPRVLSCPSCAAKSAASEVHLKPAGVKRPFSLFVATRAPAHFSVYTPLRPEIKLITKMIAATIKRRWINPPATSIKNPTNQITIITAKIIQSIRPMFLTLPFRLDSNMYPRIIYLKPK